MWERIDTDDEDEVLSWDGAAEIGESVLVQNSSGAEVFKKDSQCGTESLLLSNKSSDEGPSLSVHSQDGRVARAILQKLSIAELRRRLIAASGNSEHLSISDRETLVERLLRVQGVQAVLAGAGVSSTQKTLSPARGISKQDAPDKTNNRLDYSRFDQIDYSKDYGLKDDDEDRSHKIPDLRGTPLEGLNPFRILAGDLTEDERRAAFDKIMKDLASKANLGTPPPPPAPDCYPIAECVPPCEPDVYTNAWFEPYDELQDTEAEQNDGSHRSQSSDSEVLSFSSNVDEELSKLNSCLDDKRMDDVVQVYTKDLATEVETQTYGDECSPQPTVSDAAREKERICKRIDEQYIMEMQKINREAHVLEAVDVDGWGLEPSQFDLVEDAEEDLTELKVLLRCCDREDNRARLQKSIRECEVKLRVKRTWAWFPINRWEWSGFEYEKPIITIDYKVPGAGKLPEQDIHCDFGTDWFDLKIWNVSYLEDPGVMYHHRVKKTRLMRDIVPSECRVKAVGDHVYVYLQKVKDPRHGYCAWPDLAAGKGRKPFKYDEDAPDGGLMEFFEGEYEKHEGYDGFRRDIGKAMEKIHRGEPIRGIDDSPIEEL